MISLKKSTKNKFMSNKHKNIWAALNYIERFLILVSAVAECLSISTFVFLLGIPIGIASSSIGLKKCAIIAGIIAQV